MIFGIIIFVVVTLLLFFIYAKVDGTFDGILAIFMGALVGLVVAVFCMFFSSAIYGGSNNNFEYSQTGKQEIYSIGNNVAVEGHFSLGYGKVDSEMYYFYYTKGENGGIVINKCNGKYAEIVEKDNEKAYLIRYEAHPKNKFWSWFWSFGNSGVAKPNEKVIFEVPIGTIKYDYNVSLGG